MLFPETLQMQFVCKATRKAIPNLLVFLGVEPKNKNTYFVERITDQAGRVSLTRAELWREMEKMQQLFPMDYSGSLDQLTGVISICVDDEGSLRARIMRLQESFPEKALRLAKLAESCANVRFRRLEQVVRLRDESQVLQFELERK